MYYDVYLCYCNSCVVNSVSILHLIKKRDFGYNFVYLEHFISPILFNFAFGEEWFSCYRYFL